MLALSQFQEIWCVDFEFSAPDGERQRPICLVALELRSKRKLRIWEDELILLASPPYPTDNRALFVAYYASAELGCHLALNWPLPDHVLDLFAEFRNLTNGRPTACGAGLLGALAWFGLEAAEMAEKDAMRQLALRGGPWQDQECQALLDYCESDVIALARLLPKMEPFLDLPRALLRGRYMRAAAIIEYNGIPIDGHELNRLKSHWQELQSNLIYEVDADYGVYEGRTFKQDRFARLLRANQIAWPHLPSGRLDLSDNTFKEMARIHHQIAPLRELRVTLSQMRLSDLAVGSDSRNRCLLSAFRARTGRNQPSNARFIFGPSVWLRSLIKPPPGHGLAYLDWSQQEFGIAAALSGDPLMMAAYRSGDPYLTFAIQAGAAPADATKDSHGSVREQFKACVLAVQYGMEARSLALRIGGSKAQAQELLNLHRATYRKFWTWSDAALDHAMLWGKLWTVFGWTVQTSDPANPRFFRNFLMQANGSEMLRLACSLVTEAGIKLCAPIHDALLIEARLEDLDQVVSSTERLMAEASAVVLDGFELGVETSLIRYPDRYRDPRGAVMWQKVQDLSERMDIQSNIHEVPVHERDAACSPSPSRPLLYSNEI